MNDNIHGRFMFNPFTTSVHPSIEKRSHWFEKQRSIDTQIIIKHYL